MHRTGNPDKFEAGTPAIINIIAFARALKFIRQSGNEIFRHPTTEKLSATLFPRLRFPGVARVSFGIENGEKDIDTLIEVLGKIAGKTKTLSQKKTEKEINYFVKATALRVYSKQ